MSESGFEELWDGSGYAVSRWHPCFVPPPVPADEEGRLHVLKSQDLLTPANEIELDNFVKIAKRAFDAELCYLSLVDRDQAVYKAKEGAWQHSQLERELCFESVVLNAPLENPFVVLDMSLDDRFRFNPMALGEDGVRFYAAFPLLIRRGVAKFAIGFLCIGDLAPRTLFSLDDQHLLQVLAEAVVRHVEIRPSFVPGAHLATDLETVSDRINFLTKVSKVKGLLVDNMVLKLIAEKLQPRVVQSEHFVTRAGDEAGAMFWLASGESRCSLKGCEIERLRRYDCFGEVAIINICKMRAAGVDRAVIKRRCVRSADVRASEQCVILQLQADDAWPLVKQVPALWNFLEKIAQIRNKRIERARGVVEGLSRAQSLGPDVSASSSFAPGIDASRRRGISRERSAPGP